MVLLDFVISNEQSHAPIPRVFITVHTRQCL